MVPFSGLVIAAISAEKVESVIGCLAFALEFYRVRGAGVNPLRGSLLSLHR
jgi:hypothetical protein